MSNQINIQVLDDGPKNTILKLVGILDTSDEAYAIIADPATLSPMWPDAPQQASTLRMKLCDFAVEDGLEVRLYWDVDGTAAGSKLINTFVGRGKFPFQSFGWLPNNAVNPTGKVGLSTEGWATGTVLSYTLYLWLVKG